jgi:hypothetical protein
MTSKVFLRGAVIAARAAVRGGPSYDFENCAVILEACLR